jgi:hypothetical protein
MGRGQRRDRLHPSRLSWVNRIGVQFAAVRYFALDGTDHATYKQQAA